MSQNTEDRLFFLINQIEEIAAVTKQQQEVITELIKKSAADNESFTETIPKIEATAKETYEELATAFQLNSKKLPEQIGLAVNKNVKEVLENTSARVLDEKLGKEITALKSSITEADEVAKNSIKNLNKWLENKVIAIWLGTVFIVFIVLALIAYVYVPSLSEIIERRNEVKSIKAEYHRYSDALASVKRANQPTNTSQNNLNPFAK